MALLAVACTGDPLERPTLPEPEPIDRSISFSESSVGQYFVSDGKAAVTLGLVRRNAAGAQALEVFLSARADKGRVELPASVTFGPDKPAVGFVLEYYCPSLAPGESDNVYVMAGELSCSFTVKRAEAQTYSAVYVRDFQRFDVEVSEADGSYIVTGEGVSRTVSMVDGRPYTCGGGMMDITEARKMLEPQTDWLPYAYLTPSTYDSAERRFNLVVADDSFTPSIEYLLLEADTDWRDCGEAMYYDRWILPGVSLNGVLFDPAEHPWRVWLQESLTTPGLYRVIDPYRGACPLALYNAAPAGSIMTVEHGSVAPTTDLFSNPDLAPISISGKPDVRW